MRKPPRKPNFERPLHRIALWSLARPVFERFVQRKIAAIKDLDSQEIRVESAHRVFSPMPRMVVRLALNLAHQEGSLGRFRIFICPESGREIRSALRHNEPVPRQITCAECGLKGLPWRHDTREMRSETAYRLLQRVPTRA